MATRWFALKDVEISLLIIKVYSLTATTVRRFNTVNKCNQKPCVASVEFLSTSVSTITAPGGHWRVCLRGRCGRSTAVGLCSRLKRADNSLRVAAQGSLISQTQSQINGLVAEFRRSVSSDNQSHSTIGREFL